MNAEKVDINYKMVLDYLQKYRNLPYKKSNNSMPLDEQKKYIEIKQKAQAACGEIKKIVNICDKLFGLNCRKTPIKYLDGTNTKFRDYLWAQMKYSGYENDPESISIFVDMADENTSRIGIALEVVDSEVKRNLSLMDRHHKHLELPLDKSHHLVYLSGSNELKNVNEIKNINYEILASMKDGTWNNGKVKIARLFQNSMPFSNEEAHKAVLEGVEGIIPYYEHVIGYKRDTSSKIIQNAKNINDKDETNMKDKLGLNTILYGPPGTGKTYKTKTYAVSICEGKTLEEVEKMDYKDIIHEYNKFLEEGRIKFTTFHQSYGYEEFIEGIKPKIIEDNGEKTVGYDIVPGVFKKFCDTARPISQPYVFIIDEINRGNISKIFGELITLIEESKRGDNPEEIKCTLPYSGEDFTVPRNVYILGTMNTADRSINLMDTALRRRFDFIEMLPELKVLKDIVIDEIEIDKMLEAINKRITVLYDKDHTIGHAYFTSLKSSSSISELSNIFKNKIIPLLQEYFYEDYEKIRLVLGDNNYDKDEYVFIKRIKNEGNIFKGDVSSDEYPDYSYEINDNAFISKESYIKIYR